MVGSFEIRLLIFLYVLLVLCFEILVNCLMKLFAFWEFVVAILLLLKVMV